MTFEEYQEKLLDQHERQQKELHSRLLQNANTIVLTLSFVFLFEMTFIGGAFPSQPSTISLERFWPCVVILILANYFLILSMALLLGAIIRFNTPWPTRDDYLEKTTLAPQIRLLAIRYAIIRAAERTMSEQEKVIAKAKRYILFGVVIGALSAVTFAFCVWSGHVTAINGVLNIGTAQALNIIGAAAILGAFVTAALYTRSMKSLSRLYSELKDDGIDQQVQIEELLLSAKRHDQSTVAIAALARAYQNDYISEAGYVWPLEHEVMYLTVNRACQMRCVGCYALEALGEGEMEVSVLDALLDIAKEAGIATITLTGGDALLYHHLEHALEMIHERGMAASIPTNGYALSDKGVYDHLVSWLEPGDCIMLSLKGWDKESYQENTGLDGYDDAISTVRKLSDAGVQVGVSMVLDEKAVRGQAFLGAVKTAADMGATDFVFSPAFEPVGQESPPTAEPIDKALLGPDAINELTKGMEESYARLCKITKGRFVIDHTLPLCFWDERFLKKLMKKHQLSNVCFLHSERGVFFDVYGNYLACNAFYARPLGLFGEDYADYRSFCDYGQSEEIREMRRSFTRPPSEQCKPCKYLSRCAGGCETRWARFSFESYAACKKW